MQVALPGPDASQDLGIALGSTDAEGPPRKQAPASSPTPHKHKHMTKRSTLFLRGPEAFGRAVLLQATRSCPPINDTDLRVACMR